MKLFDVVELLADLPDFKLCKGQQGTIVEIHNENICEVEFCDDQGITVYLGALSLKEFRIVWHSP